ncbi:endoplasmic reticulum retention protein [Clydaea vesicula]|uniref:Endoplasmic reticulum retention protein n=1 Tax=Clydaea vesicula TaxID=447962 RepID=A0AAD5U7A6_9FUNG|nr:endoplasmic reticulum retention protein [Clydaea vesicula]
MWSFSVILESVAIIPQMSLLVAKKKLIQLETDAIKDENILIVKYIAALGIYKGLYVINWLFRYFFQGRISWIQFFGGILQVLVVIAFLGRYYRRIKKEYYHIIEENFSDENPNDETLFNLQDEGRYLERNSFVISEEDLPNYQGQGKVDGGENVKFANTVKEEIPEQFLSAGDGLDKIENDKV